jgi:hypothetical protein
MKPLFGFAVAALFAAQTASASTVTLSGSSVDFTYDDTLLSLFGAPTVVNDSLYFTPTSFDVASLNGAGINITNATVNIEITPKIGFDLDSVALDERGDYLLLGHGTEGVEATGQLRAFELSNPAILETASIASTPTTATGLPTSNWSAFAGINLDTPTWLPGGGINLTIENILLAYTSNPVSLAFIEKKFVGVSLIASPVPEPSNRSLLLSSLGLIGFLVHRRSSGSNRE